MKTLILSLFLLFGGPIFSQNITVLQINAQWNSGNSRSDLSKLKGCKYEFGWLEDQPKSIIDNISSVPTIIIFVDNRPRKIYRADLSLKLGVPLKEIQEEVDNLRQ